MAGSNFPTSLDDGTTLPDPTAASYTNNPSHVGLHSNANAAIKALEAKVGIGASPPPGNGYIFTSTSNGVSSWQPAPAAGVWGLITGTLSDQTDLLAALNAKVAKSGGTMTGLLILSADPNNALGAVTKQYADGKLSLGGGTLTGALLLSADPAAALGAATKQYVDALGSTTLVRNETPGGSVNGSNTAYTTASTYATGSLRVHLNGQRLAPGSGIDYVEVTQGFTMQYAPATSDVLLVDYETTNTSRFVQGSNSYIVQETPTGLVNSSNALFTTLQGKYVANSLEVFVNGIQYTKTTDYVETSPGAGTFTFTTAPVTGQAVRISYQFATGASGNADTVDGLHASATPTANQLVALDGNALVPSAAIGGAGVSWVPTLANISGGTLNQAKYIRVGNLIFFRVKYTFAGAGMGTAPTFSLPVAANADYAADTDHKIGTVRFIKSGTQLYEGWVAANSATVAKLYIYTVSGSNIIGTQTPTATQPFTWANLDYLIAEGVYEVA